MERAFLFVVRWFVVGGQLLLVGGRRWWSQFRSGRLWLDQILSVLQRKQDIPSGGGGISSWRLPGVLSLLSVAKNLARTGTSAEILHCAQNDWPCQDFLPRPL